MKYPFKIGIRVDAGPLPDGRNAGLGHVIRCIALAKELSLRGAHCWFRANDMAQVLAVREGFPVVGVRQGTPLAANVWIIDLPRGCPPREAQAFRPRCEKLVVLNGVGYSTDDPSRFLSDLVVYQGCSNRPYELNWEGFHGEWREGASWVILRREFPERHRPARKIQGRPRVILSGGGENIGGLLDTIAGEVAGHGFELRAITKRDCNLRDKLDKLDIESIERPRNVAEVMAWADVAVISYGMTAFECLCLGIPVVALSLREDHQIGAALVEERSGGALFAAGLVSEMRGGELPLLVDRHLTDLERSSSQALAFVDGRGVERVADLILGEEHV